MCVRGDVTRLDERCTPSDASASKRNWSEGDGSVLNPSLDSFPKAKPVVDGFVEFVWLQGKGRGSV